jgi:hypothetical protein
MRTSRMGYQAPAWVSKSCLFIFYLNFISPNWGSLPLDRPMPSSRVEGTIDL